MGNGMSQVLPGLYVGNFRDSENQEQLKLNCITHIVSIHDNPKKLVKDKEYLCIRAADTPSQNLQQYFPVCNDFIHNARLNGGSVLIHCLAGVSRSVTITVAYIMSTTGLSYRDALNTVRGARQVANPNYGFQKQLYDYERSKLYEERLRIREKFPGNTLKDEQECRKLLVAYHSSARTIDKSTSSLPSSSGSGSKLGRQNNPGSSASASFGNSPVRSLPSPRFSPRASPRSSPRSSVRMYGADMKKEKS